MVKALPAAAAPGNRVTRDTSVASAAADPMVIITELVIAPTRPRIAPPVAPPTVTTTSPAAKPVVLVTVVAVSAEARAPAEPAVVTRVVEALAEPILTTVAVAAVVIVAFVIIDMDSAEAIAVTTPKVPAVAES